MHSTAEVALWVQMARDVGLLSALVSEGSMVGWSFASVRRELAEPAMPEPKTTPWLHGERAEVLVAAEGVVPPSRLGKMIDGVVAVVDALTPPLPSAGPFR